MNKMIQLTPRQKAIVNLLAKETGTSKGEIAQWLPPMFSVSKATLARDLGTLVKAKLILSGGNGPTTLYKPAHSSLRSAPFECAPRTPNGEGGLDSLNII
jgi:DeoR/GlpR family transcriptional regulator of sugar metabolism